MKSIAFLIGLFLSMPGSMPGLDDSVEFVCQRKHMASNTCHYNFKVDGAKYRFVDMGCKFKKSDVVITKVKNGTLALAKDWKIECRESQ